MVLAGGCLGGGDCYLKGVGGGQLVMMMGENTCEEVLRVLLPCHSSSLALASSSDAEHEPLLPKQTHLLGCLQVFFSIFLAAMGAAQAQLFFPGGRLPACASDVWQR